jgi:formate dehydrogenase subunit gamma
MHKLNTGQKAFYLCLLLFGFLIILSGAGIWLMPNHQKVMIWSVIIHNISFILIGIFLPIHIYLSTLGNPGTLQIMTSGKVPVWWARKKSQLWVEEVEQGKSH